MGKTTSKAAKATPVIKVPAVAAEVSFEDRLAEIDRQAKERLAEEKRRLAAGYLSDARKRVAKLLAATTDDALREAMADVAKLEKIAGETNGHRLAGAEGTGRVRRSTEELTSEAQQVAAFLKANPGSKSSAVIAATGINIKPPLNVRTFIEKYLPGVKVKTDGAKAGTTYRIG